MNNPRSGFYIYYIYGAEIFEFKKITHIIHLNIYIYIYKIDTCLCCLHYVYTCVMLILISIEMRNTLLNYTAFESDLGQIVHIIYNVKFSIFAPFRSIVSS